MENVIKTFQACNKSGDGLITYTELGVLLRTVDPGITPENFSIMMEETGAKDQDRMKFEEVALWINGDRGVPAVIKAEAGAAADRSGEPPKGEEAEEDEEQSVADEGDMDMLAAELELEGIDLDLDRRITRKEWLLIMDELHVDMAEANELFDDITVECTAAGLGNADSGYPLREFLEELRVEVEDLESLKAISNAANAAKTKLDKVVETQAVDNPKALNPALDRLVRELDKAKRPATDAWEIFREGAVPASMTQKLALGSFEGRQDELVAKVKQFMVTPPLLSAVAGQNACRQLCTYHVDNIIKECKESGKKFTDPEWNQEADSNAVLYVDKERPGWDCTVAKPAGYKRLTEIVENPVLFKGGMTAGDIIQGQIGTCFLLGAMGAVVSNNQNALRKLFIKHDVEHGVYGIRFCLDGEWTWVIVDDVMPVDSSGRLLYAHSKDPQEVWCPILEKAYCKLHTCYEMCDGGFSTEAIFKFFGGVSGSLDIKDSHRENPASYFKLLKQARSHGWLLTTHFAPQKGAMAGTGKCGEATFDSGLVGGHCYSVLRVVEAAGNQLVCCRNPWGQGEWKGKWSDKNTQGEWTDEMKAACSYKGLGDGKFWMCAEDFVQNAGQVRYARPFGPNWKKATQYKTFQKGPMLATAKYTYAARAGDELSIEKGCSIEVQALSAGWWYGKKAGEDKGGYFPGNYVRLNDRPIARFDLTGTKAEGVDLMTVVVLLMQPDSAQQRKFYKRKEDGLNYKDTSYPCMQLCIVNPEGKVHVKKRGRKREVWAELKIPGGQGWRIYAYSVDGKGSRLVLRTYVKDGTLTLTDVPGTQIAELHEAIAKR